MHDQAPPCDDCPTLEGLNAGALEGWRLWRVGTAHRDGMAGGLDLAGLTTYAAAAGYSLQALDLALELEAHLAPKMKARADATNRD